MNRVRRRLTFSNLLAGLAIFIALGGVAYAGSQIGTNDIQDGAVTTRKLADKAVTGRKIDKARLGIVPEASTVGGMRIDRFSAKPAPGTPLTFLMRVGPLRLLVGCSAGTGRPLFSVTPAGGTAPQGTRVSVTLNGNAGDTANNTVGKGQGTLPPSGISVLDGSES